MSERIDHAAEAREWLGAAERPVISLDETTAFADIAQAHATLALVEQQRIANEQARIANLIALADKFDQPEATDALLARTPPRDGKGWVHHGLQPGIREALGLRE